MPRGQRPLWGRTKATMDQSKATFPLECLCQPLRAKAYKGGNLAKLWSISSGRGAIFIYGTIQSCWNFTRRQLSPILKFECKPLLVIVSNPSSGNKFNEKKIKLKQMRFSIFCHRPSSRANVSLPTDLLLGPNWLSSSHDSQLFHFLLNSNWLLASFVCQWFNNALASLMRKNILW